VEVVDLCGRFVWGKRRWRTWGMVFMMARPQGWTDGRRSASGTRGRSSPRGGSQPGPRVRLASRDGMIGPSHRPEVRLWQGSRRIDITYCLSAPGCGVFAIRFRWESPGVCGGYPFGVEPPTSWTGSLSGSSRGWLPRGFYGRRGPTCLMTASLHAGRATDAHRVCIPSSEQAWSICFFECAAAGRPFHQAPLDPGKGCTPGDWPRPASGTWQESHSRDAMELHVAAVSFSQVWCWPGGWTPCGQENHRSRARDTPGGRPDSLGWTPPTPAPHSIRRRPPRQRVCGREPANVVFRHSAWCGHKHHRSTAVGTPRVRDGRRPATRPSAWAVRLPAAQVTNFLGDPVTHSGGFASWTARSDCGSSRGRSLLYA